MLNCYETTRGDYAPAYALTATEALDLHRRGVLCASDYGSLSRDARDAVRAELEQTASGHGRCRVVYVHWGVRQPTRAYQGRA